MENLYDPAHACSCGLMHEPGRNHHAEAMKDDRAAHLKQKVVGIRDRVMPVVKDKVESARWSADHAATIARTRVHVAGLRARQYARENPRVLAGVSAGLGVLLGMITRGMLRRNRHLGVLIVETRPGSHAVV